MIANDEFKALLQYQHWVVAYSGGIDSTVLLHAAKNFLSSEQATSAKPQPQLSAIHINHQLQADAKLWQQHCNDICNSWVIPFEAVKVVIELAEIQKSGLEASARNHRYRIFSQYDKPNTIVLTAHHLDDQAETVLMRLFRGSGESGLAGIPAIREHVGNSKVLDSTVKNDSGKIVRPFLVFSKRAIQQYATDHQLRFIEDPSNNDTQFDRNFIRGKLIPLVQTRWPALIDNLARTAGHAATHIHLARELAEIDMQSVDKQSDEYGNSISLPAIALLSEHRQINLIRYWLEQFRSLMPSAKQMQQVISVANSSRPSAQVALDTVNFFRFKQRLYCIETDVVERFAAAAVEFPFAWNTDDVLELAKVGVLSAIVGQEISRGLVPGDYFVDSRAKQEGQEYLFQGQHRSLKKLLQEQGVPPWARDVYPVVYQENKIAAVGDILICDDFESRQGLKLKWQWF